MRIDRLTVRNFRCFAERTFDFSPEFNVLIGDNGSGKTAVLEALAIAAGSWLIGMSDISSRPIRSGNMRLAPRILDGELTFEDQSPVEVSAWGQVLGEDIAWGRTLTSREGKTTLNEARTIGRLSKQAQAQVRAGEPVTLPVVVYYGAGRLWLPPRKTDPPKSNGTISSQRTLSRFQGYSNAIDERVNSGDLMRWLERQDRIAYQEGSESPLYRVVREAMQRMTENAEDVVFNNRRLEVVVRFTDRAPQPFGCLSDGQRSMLALVGDLAMRMARLNPQFGENVLNETPGVVLIDELDLHLHPNWQRHVVDDLRRTFPKVQFIATTHSPFIVQTLREGELLTLEGQPIPQLGNLGIEEIARGIMGVERPEVSPRYRDMVETAKDYLTTLDEAADLQRRNKKNSKSGWPRRSLPMRTTRPIRLFSNSNARSNSVSDDTPMRPVLRAANPIQGDFTDYRNAFPYLCSRLGRYCSYCERRILANLAVEHIQPKALPAYAALIGRWDNFLLGCVNCNATKKDKVVLLDKLYFPDRDNTFAVFTYTADGRVEPVAQLNTAQQQMARDTLALTGLDKRLSRVEDENGRLVAIDRVSQRMEVWGIAEESRSDLEAAPIEQVRRQIVRTALATGFFSIWMQVFALDADMRRRFIEAFPGTAQDCFDARTQSVSPRPANGLPFAGKI